MGLAVWDERMGKNGYTGEFKTFCLFFLMSYILTCKKMRVHACISPCARDDYGGEVGYIHANRSEEKVSKLLFFPE